MPSLVRRQGRRVHWDHKQRAGGGEQRVHVEDRVDGEELRDDGPHRRTEHERQSTGALDE